MSIDASYRVNIGVSLEKPQDTQIFGELLNYVQLFKTKMSQILADEEEAPKKVLELDNVIQEIQEKLRLFKQNDAVNHYKYISQKVYFALYNDAVFNRNLLSYSAVALTLNRQLLGLRWRFSSDQKFSFLVPQLKGLMQGCVASQRVGYKGSPWLCRTVAKASEFVLEQLPSLAVAQPEISVRGLQRLQQLASYSSEEYDTYQRACLKTYADKLGWQLPEPTDANVDIAKLMAGQALVSAKLDELLALPSRPLGDIRTLHSYLLRGAAQGLLNMQVCKVLLKHQARLSDILEVEDSIGKVITSHKQRIEQELPMVCLLLMSKMLENTHFTWVPKHAGFDPEPATKYGVQLAQKALVLDTSQHWLLIVLCLHLRLPLPPGLRLGESFLELELDMRLEQLLKHHQAPLLESFLALLSYQLCPWGFLKSQDNGFEITMYVNNFGCHQYSEFFNRLFKHMPKEVKLSIDLKGESVALLTDVEMDESESSPSSSTDMQAEIDGEDNLLEGESEVSERLVETYPTAEELSQRGSALTKQLLGELFWRYPLTLQLHAALSPTDWLEINRTLLVQQGTVKRFTRPLQQLAPALAYDIWQGRHIALVLCEAPTRDTIAKIQSTFMHVTIPFGLQEEYEGDIFLTDFLKVAQAIPSLTHLVIDKDMNGFDEFLAQAAEDFFSLENVSHLTYELSEDSRDAFSRLLSCLPRLKEVHFTISETIFSANPPMRQALDALMRDSRLSISYALYTPIQSFFAQS